MMQRTYGMRLPGDPERDGLLDAYAALYGRAQRRLFARLRAGEPLAALKRAFLVRCGLTARQFNALAAEVRGQLTSIAQRRQGIMAHLAQKIARAETVLRKMPRGTEKAHQKQRRLALLRHRLRAVRDDETAGRVRLCFGSRKLFRAQFAMTANGYASHADWRRDWRDARSAQFLVIGSKDETAGCQGCVAALDTDGSITLRLRVPNALARRQLHLVIPDLRFRYGHAEVVAAIGRNLAPDKEERGAISWRFVRDHKGWRVLATVSVPAAKRSSVDNIGVVAVDLNTNHLAVTDLDRFGNPGASYRIPCATQGRTRQQTAAIIGDVVSQVVTYACLRQKPIVGERLDFDAKKAEMEHRGAGYARMLSAFAYATFHTILHARCYDAGIAVWHVNPAYTSVIGTHTVADRYGLSRHQAAACAIGRRGMDLAERPNRRMGDHVAFPLPVRNRGKHVWSFWRQVAWREAALTARGAAGPPARSSPAARSARRVISSPAAGGIPAREPSATLFG